MRKLQKLEQATVLASPSSAEVAPLPKSPAAADDPRVFDRRLDPEPPTTEDWENFGYAFDQADQFGDGQIPLRKVGTVLAQIGLPLSDDELQVSLDELDVLRRNADRCISRADFLLLVALHLGGARQSGEGAEPAPKRCCACACCVYTLYYFILFWAHWFGANRFDFNHDGEFDPSDVRALMDNGWGHLQRNFHVGDTQAKKAAGVPTKARKGARQEPADVQVSTSSAIAKLPDEHAHEIKSKARMAAVIMGKLRIDALQGDWLVGAPGADFMVTIQEGGTCLYDGRYMGEDNDLFQEGQGLRRQIKRPDGWSLDMRRSTLQVLLWTYPGQAPLEWRRIPQAGELSLPHLMGEWVVIENGHRTDQEVHVGDQGYTLWNGQHFSGQDLRSTMPLGSVIPEIRRGGGWVADAMRSNAEVVLWVNAGESVISEWRRPRPPSVAHTLGNIGLDVLDSAGDLQNLVIDVFSQEVEGEAFEDMEGEHIREMFSTRQVRPNFVLFQVFVSVGLWVAGGIYSLVTDDGVTLFDQVEVTNGTATPVSVSFLSIKAGLDTWTKGITTLKLIETDCTSYRFQVYRWWLYQFTHVGANHVAMNAILTLLLGIPLEAMCGAFRMFLMFNGGVLGGAFCYGVWDGANEVVGMSGGCYALIGIHFAEIIQNWKRMKFGWAKVFLLVFLIAIENVNHYFGGVHEADSRAIASNSAHFGGVIAGFVSGCLIGYNKEWHFYEYMFAVAVALFGVALSIFSTYWIFSHEDPFPIWEWQIGNQPTYWYQQVWNGRCFGDEWRCTRCRCLDTACRANLAAATSQGWARLDVGASQCPSPWYTWAQGVDAGSRASIEFDTVPVSTRTSVCYTNFG